jgi:hypothetical protein
MAEEESRRFWWRRFLDQATVPQKLLLSLGAIAGALVAIGTLVIAVGDRLGDDDDGSDSIESLSGTTVESKTDDADQLIRGLLAAAGSDSKTVLLDVKVLADPSQPTLNSADIHVYFNCDTGDCSRARLQFPEGLPVTTNPLGLDLEGSWAVTLASGLDFDSTQLDIQLIPTAAP